MRLKVSENIFWVIFVSKRFDAGKILFILEKYYHFRSTLKRDDFFAYVYFSNVTVSQTSVSSGPMKMRCFGRETNNVCQTTVACFVRVAGRFSSLRLYFSSYNLLIGWQVLGFQILSRITQMAPVQIKVVYDYYSAKRTTPFLHNRGGVVKFGLPQL